MSEYVTGDMMISYHFTTLLHNKVFFFRYATYIHYNSLYHASSQRAHSNPIQYIVVIFLVVIVGLLVELSIMDYFIITVLY